MKLSITATLTEQEVLTLAKAKGRQETVMQDVPVEVVEETTKETTELAEPVDEMLEYETVKTEKVEVPNPQSAEDFVVSVYKAMIVKDATKIFTDTALQELKHQTEVAASKIRGQVESFIDGSIQ